MHKTLFAVFVGAGMLSASTFAQVVPGTATATGTTQAGAAMPGAPAMTDSGIGTSTSPATTDASGTSALGLGGLLKQTQTQEDNPATDTATDGAGPTGSLSSTKARLKAHAHGH